MIYIFTYDLHTNELVYKVMTSNEPNPNPEEAEEERVKRRQRRKLRRVNLRL